MSSSTIVFYINHSNLSPSARINFLALLKTQLNFSLTLIWVGFLGVRLLPLSLKPVSMF